MRFTLCTIALLLGACADRPALAREPAFSIDTGDLAIGTPSGRAELRRRVVAATRRFCAAHGADIAPYEHRDDPYYCPDMARSAAMARMSGDLRRAYLLARREAGVRGSQP